MVKNPKKHFGAAAKHREEDAAAIQSMIRCLTFQSISRLIMSKHHILSTVFGTQCVAVGILRLCASVLMEAEVELNIRIELDMDLFGGCRDKMVSRVYKGIPDSMRGAAWKLLLDIDRKKEEQRGRYRVRPFALV